MNIVESLDPKFLRSVARITVHILKSDHDLFGGPDNKTKAAAHSIALHPMMARHARTLKRAATPPKERKKREPRKFSPRIPAGYFRLPEHLSQPADALAEVYVSKGVSRMARLSALADEDAIRGAWPFYYLKRTKGNAAFDVATIEFADGHTVRLNADSLIAVENLYATHQVAELDIDFGFDDGRGPFTIQFLNNRHYRRHCVALTVAWEDRSIIPKIRSRIKDSVDEDNTLRKYYFALKEILALAKRARAVGVSFEPRPQLRGTRLLKVRDLKRSMKIAGATTDEIQPSFTIKAVAINPAAAPGICVHGDYRMPFYRLHGIPIFSPPMSLKAQWNEDMAPAS